MPNETVHTRVCPTRIDAQAALFAHRVTTPQCQDRQRGRYHKCFTCAYNNAYVAAHGLPTEVRREASKRGPMTRSEPSQSGPEPAAKETEVLAEARAV